MPKFDHKDLGDVLSYVYLPGLVKAVDAEKDTADVEIRSGNSTALFSSCPVFYHCDKVGKVLDNGSIENGSRGFSVGDEALCRCFVSKDKKTKDFNPSFDKVILVGHVSGPKRCSYKYAFVRASLKELKELKTPLGQWDYSKKESKYVYTAFDKDSHKDELCFIYDGVLKKVASIIDPSGDGEEKFEFPCSVEKLKPFLDSTDLELDRELYTWTRQGSSPDSIEFASAYPSHTADFEGKNLGVNATGDPYDTFLFDNEVQAIFTQFTNTIASFPSSEVRSGKFAMFDALKKSKEEDFATYASRSKGFLVDTRSKPVPRAPIDKDESQCVAISPSGESLTNSSYHVQALYGENEYWLCAKNTYMGLIVSYCDAYWKFIRVSSLPYTFVIDNPALTSLANGLPSISPMASVGAAVAAITMQGSSNGSIWDSCVLKRFNEGCVHRTTVPAVGGVSSSETTESTIKNFNGVGSYFLTQRPHEEREDDPPFHSAVNSRLEHIDCWNRIDNWMNSMNYAFSSGGSGPEGHFVSVAYQWRLSSVYIDTPIGSFLYGSPRLQAALWSMYRTQITGSMSRNDLPFNSHFIAKTRQTGACCMQIYIVQRQCLTAWNEDVDKKGFSRQVLLYGPYDSRNVTANYEIGSEPPAPQIKQQIPSDATYSGDFKPGGEASGSWDGSGLSESDDAPPASGAVGAANSFTWDEDEQVRFIRKDDKLVDFLELSDEDKASLVEDRFFITSETDTSKRGSYPLSRNEIEIMASFDTFSSLKTDEKGSKDNKASSAVRSKDFEIAIKDFLKKFYDDVVDKAPGAVKNKTFSMFYFDAKII